jgi:hypothetical protein
MRSALKEKSKIDAKEKSRLIREAHGTLVAANKINETESVSPEKLAEWYDANMPGVTNIKQLAGAMEIEMRTRRGVAIQAEGERRGGSRKVSDGPTLSGTEKTKRHEDRVLAENQEAVAEYVQETIEAGEVPTATGAIRAVKPKKEKDEPKEERPDITPCVLSFTAPASLAHEIDLMAEERKLSTDGLLLKIVETALRWRTI